ncbi:thioredoxin family protein [Frateuria aurantia]|uniref:Thiol:disulfide interchange protein n=1 Tax=Frateuria aurantia (strain ATCC 33424 / DSM 6220 / KCTC 2777 / LMG 1558 / NBRC 3245 / NCIMB 13370) TaxID=767434 RepID=H8KYV2_FRAAD|nr:thioredoxin family protein [Frateuria aurantia]AFC86171.1 thiol:disulfide interchange protein [Frateuria aurantia DSM 6220]
MKPMLGLALWLAAGWMGPDAEVMAQSAPTNSVADSQLTTIDQALLLARQKHQPVFVDFSASWCHSCFAMRDHVLTGPQWEAEKKKFVLIESDADSDNGSAWMEKLKVPSLPTYLILNPDGSERARIIGEVPQAKFMQTLDVILAGQGSLEQRQARAAKGSMVDLAAVIEDYLGRFKVSEGLAWFRQLPAPVRQTAATNPLTAPGLSLLQMRELASEVDLATAQQKPLAGLISRCRRQADKALAYAHDRHRFAVVSSLASCVQSLPLAERRAVLARPLASLQPLLQQVFGRDAAKVDLLEYTTEMEWIYGVVQQPDRKKAVQDQAIATARRLLDDGRGGLDVRHNRSVAENLQIILDHAGENAARLKVLKLLAEAYPDEYYYLQEYGSALVAAGDASQGLPLLDRAVRLAPAEKQESLAWPRTKALMQLHRQKEAEAVVAAVLKAHPHPAPGPEAYQLQDLQSLLKH